MAVYWTCTGVAVAALGIAILLRFASEVSVPFPYVWYAFRPEYLRYTGAEIVVTICAGLIYSLGLALRYMLAGPSPP